MSRAAPVKAAWRLTAHEVAHALPVLQWLHAGLRSSPPPRLATIRALAERHRIADGTLRTALSRACASGTLTSTDGRYRIGPVSIEQAASARALRTRAPGYTLAVISEGKQRELALLKVELTRLGFRPLQRSIWVGARTREARLRPALNRAHLANAVLIFDTLEVDGASRARLTKLWDLDARARVLRAFHASLMSWVTGLRLGDHEAAWRTVEAAPTWYRVTVGEEPPFPLALCGADYPLGRLNAAWRAHLARMTPALIAMWSSMEKP